MALFAALFGLYSKRIPDNEIGSCGPSGTSAGGWFRSILVENKKSAFPLSSIDYYWIDPRDVGIHHSRHGVKAKMIEYVLSHQIFV